MPPASHIHPPHPFSHTLAGLQHTPKHIPFSLLYDRTGSLIYEQITALPEYYPFASELHLLRMHAHRIASTVAPDSLVVELGCGTASKTSILLNALQARHGSCQYAGIDVSGTALEEAYINLLQHVEGLSPSNVLLIQGEYLEGLKQVRQTHPDRMICILWLGSSVGNLTQDSAIDFFKQILTVVGAKCQIFLGTDMWKDEATLLSAYRNSKGVTERFAKNGMKNALSLLGYEVSQEEEDSWFYDVEVNKHLKQVEMRLVFPRGLRIERHQVHIKSKERVLVAISRKFRIEDIQELASKSGFHVHEAWRNKKYGCQLLLPGLEALLRCWNDTDAIFREIPDWGAKPIDLRHPFGFYYGHINAFTKIKLLSADGFSKFDYIFSRGIDPIVLEPSKCHSHPKIPPQWPSKEGIMRYVESTRTAVKAVVMSGNVSMTLLSLALEHERMHQETLAYMLTQQRKASFERDVFTPKHLQYDGLNQNGLVKPIAMPSVHILAGEVTLGTEPKDDVFVWDNEKPLFRSSVQESFLVSPKPVTIEEYLRFVLEGGYDRKDLWQSEDFTYFQEQGFKWPATWSMRGGTCYVHGHNATKHWSEVAGEPALVSLSEAEAFCNWVGCRVMTEVEYQRILDTEAGMEVAELKEGGWEWTSTRFEPFPGFEPLKEYKEYSTDFFDGKHYVLKGASQATHPCMHRESFRNFYQRQYRYVFAKFRCCSSSTTTMT